MIERASLADAYEARPRHVAIVMEGTESWAREHGRSRSETERAAALTLRETVRTAARYGIEILTVHARSEGVARTFALEHCEALRRSGVRIRTLGRLDGAPQATRSALTSALEATADCRGMRLNIALNYGARTELCDAFRALARDVRDGRLSLAAIDDDLLSKYLYTWDLPDPDLLIRTGGELRISNFLLYQIAYSELWSTPTLWPSFAERDFASALAAFASRQRRFGS